MAPTKRRRIRQAGAHRIKDARVPAQVLRTGQATRQHQHVIAGKNAFDSAIGHDRDAVAAGHAILVVHAEHVTGE